MRLSIITVTFNAESTVERTMQSVAAQTYGDIEHLVIDGASKDRTVEIAEKYGARVVSEPDKGLYDAMNKGINLATGDYLLFLNAGDKLHDSETIAKVMRAAEEEHSPAVIYGDTAIVDNEGKFLRLRRLRPPKVLTWRSFSSGMLVCHQSFFVNRNVVKLYDLKYRFSADFDWCIKCLRRATRQTLLVTEPYGMKDEHGKWLVLSDYLSEGMTTANHKASLKERYDIMVKYYGAIPTALMHLWFVFRSVLKR